MGETLQLMAGCWVGQMPQKKPAEKKTKEAKKEDEVLDGRLSSLQAHLGGLKPAKKPRAFYHCCLLGIVNLWC